AASGVAAPGVNANAGTQQAATSQRATIDPTNALERAFVSAAHEQNQRAAFRRIFLDSQVALATVSDAAGAAPRIVTLGPAGGPPLTFPRARARPPDRGRAPAASDDAGPQSPAGPPRRALRNNHHHLGPVPPPRGGGRQPVPRRSPGPRRYAALSWARPI